MNKAEVCSIAIQTDPISTTPSAVQKSLSTTPTADTRKLRTLLPAQHRPSSTTPSAAYSNPNKLRAFHKLLRRSNSSTRVSSSCDGVQQLDIKKNHITLSLIPVAQIKEGTVPRQNSHHTVAQLNANRRNYSNYCHYRKLGAPSPEVFINNSQLPYIQQDKAPQPVNTNSRSLSNDATLLAIQSNQTTFDKLRHEQHRNSVVIRPKTSHIPLANRDTFSSPINGYEVKGTSFLRSGQVLQEKQTEQQVADQISSNLTSPGKNQIESQNETNLSSKITTPLSRTRSSLPRPGTYNLYPVPVYRPVKYNNDYSLHHMNRKCKKTPTGSDIKGSDEESTLTLTENNIKLVVGSKQKENCEKKLPSGVSVSTHVLKWIKESEDHQGAYRTNPFLSEMEV